MKKYWAQGDVVIKPSIIPIEAKEKVGEEKKVIAKGEHTNHAHRIIKGDAVLFLSPQGMVFIRVKSQEAVIGHETHEDMVLPKGEYEVNQQIEWDQIEGVRKVLD